MNNEMRGKFIAKLRKKYDLTQEELGNLLHYSRNNISKWENGLSTPSDPETLKKLSEIFDVTVEELMYGEKLDNQDKKNITSNLDNEIRKVSKVKKNIFIIILIMMIFIILLSVFIVYNKFIKNSVNLYSLYLDDDNFYMNESFLFISNDNSIFSFNTIGSKNDEEVQFIKIYYFKNNEQIALIEGDNKYYLLEDNSYKLYKLKKYDLYMDIITDKNEYEKIKLVKDTKYVNDKIVYHTNDDSSEVLDDYKNYDKSILLEEGFITSNNDLYIRIIDNDRYISIEGNKLFMIYEYDNDKVSFIEGSLTNDEFIYYDNEEEYIVVQKEKNCNIDNCQSYNDYAEYLYYLKNLIIKSN